MKAERKTRDNLETITRTSMSACTTYALKNYCLRSAVIRRFISFSAAFLDCFLSCLSSDSVIFGHVNHSSSSSSLSHPVAGIQCRPLQGMGVEIIGEKKRKKEGGEELGRVGPLQYLQEGLAVASIAHDVVVEMTAPRDDNVR